jgi:hypothetical protein
MSLDPRPLPRIDWPAYYDGLLAGAKYGAIVLFYAARSDAVARQSEASVLSGDPTAASASLGMLSSLIPGQPGISDLTTSLFNDKTYRLQAVGSYDSTLVGGRRYGVYAIWRKF